MTWAMLVPRKGWRRGSLINSDTAESRSDVTTSQRLRQWRGKSHKLAEKGARLFQRVRQWGDSQSNGVIERAVGLVAGQARTLKAALEHRMETRIAPGARILCWLVECAAYLMNWCDIGSDGKTPLHRLHGRRDNTPILEFGEDSVHSGQASQRRIEP